MLLAGLLLAELLLAGCARQATPRGLERVALLSVENLSDDASLNWLTRAVPDIAASQLSGLTHVVPLRADTSREASAQNATQLVHGYFDRRRGEVHFEFSIEDADTHVMRPLTVDGEALIAAATIAKAVDGAAVPFSSNNAAAVEAWGRGEPARAVALDADFGRAWLDLIRSQPPELAAHSASQALAQGGLRAPIDRAQITLRAAQLAGDSDAIGTSSMGLAKLLPADATVARQLAEQESNGRRFQNAIQLYQTVVGLEPANTAVYNQLGYAQFFGGDLAAARRSFDIYSKSSGQEANGADSQGEVLFMAGQFKEAEAYFLKAHAANPNLLAGGDLWKAAYARWLAGDLAGADRHFEDYGKFRAKAGDPNVPWSQAVWEHATGREARAMERLRSASGPLVAAQLKVWGAKPVLPDQVPQLEQAWKQSAPGNDGVVRVLYGLALVKAGRKEDAQKVAAWWPLPPVGEASPVGVQLYKLYAELRNQVGK